jgi:hypothetical protein
MSRPLRALPSLITAFTTVYQHYSREPPSDAYVPIAPMLLGLAPASIGN